jgi:hypothetical protein
MSPAGNRGVTSAIVSAAGLGAGAADGARGQLGGPDMTTTLDHRPALPLRPIERPRPLVPRSGTDRGTGRAEARTGWERNSDRRDRLALALSELFGARGDLEGVSVVADLLAEDLLWSA